MLSAGMLTDLASAMIVRRRGLVEGSPPPFRAATVSSLMMRVKTLPRLASAAPFLCLMVCHLAWPDMIVLQGLKSSSTLQSTAGLTRPDLSEPVRTRPDLSGPSLTSPDLSGPVRTCPDLSPLPRQQDPDVRPRVPRAALVVSERGRDLEPRAFEALCHLRHGEGAE